MSAISSKISEDIDLSTSFTDAYFSNKNIDNDRSVGNGASYSSTQSNPADDDSNELQSRSKTADDDGGEDIIIIRGFGDKINGKLAMNSTTVGSSMNNVEVKSIVKNSADAVVSEIVEITEENEEPRLHSSRGQMTHAAASSTSLFSIDNRDVVYVAVGGKSETSMDALMWTLLHSVNPHNTYVYLVHVYPPLKFIPSPLGGGWVAKDQVSSELAERYMEQETSKRRQLLSKFMNKCSDHLVQVDTILIESELVAEAMVELISVLNIPKLVVGISKSGLRKLRAGKGSGLVAERILQCTPKDCEVKIICQGEDVCWKHSDNQITQIRSPLNLTTNSRSPKAISSQSGAASENDIHQKEQQQPAIAAADHSSLSCCFRPNF